MALISTMDPTEAGELLYKKFMAAHEANKGGAPEDHPSRDVQKWNRIAATGGTNSEKRIQSQDDDQPEITERGNAGATPAQDFALAEARIRQSGSANLEGDLWALRARQTDPRKVRAVAAAIHGYDRLK